MGRQSWRVKDSLASATLWTCDIPEHSMLWFPDRRCPKETFWLIYFSRYIFFALRHAACTTSTIFLCALFQMFGSGHVSFSGHDSHAAPHLQFQAVCTNNLKPYSSAILHISLFRFFFANFFLASYSSARLVSNQLNQDSKNRSV